MTFQSPESDSRGTNGISGRTSNPPRFLLPSLLQSNAAPTLDGVQTVFVSAAVTAIFSLF